MATAKKPKPAPKPAPKPKKVEAVKASPLPTADKPLKAKADAPLSSLVAKIVAQYESQAEAARQLDIGKTYLSRLQAGIKENPSDDTLSKLGIVRQVRYSFAAA